MSVNNKYWSAKVTKKDNHTAVTKGLFTSKNPLIIAKGLAHSALDHCKSKSTPFKTAMDRLNFYINRAGDKLSVSQKQILNQSKIYLRKLFNKK